MCGQIVQQKPTVEDRQSIPIVVPAATFRNGAGQRLTSNDLDRYTGIMPVQIAGTQYFSAAELAKALGVSRQTFWRWGSDGKIPPGQRYRNKQLVFTQAEFDAIRDYAHRIEPVSKKPATEPVREPNVAEAP